PARQSDKAEPERPDQTELEDQLVAERRAPRGEDQPCEDGDQEAVSHASAEPDRDLLEPPFGGIAKRTQHPCDRESVELEQRGDCERRPKRCEQKSVPRNEREKADETGDVLAEAQQEGRPPVHRVAAAVAEVLPG